MIGRFARLEQWWAVNQLCGRLSRVSQWRTPLVVVAWIPITLFLDHNASLTVQNLLGVVTWALLLLLLAAEVPLVRVQTAVVVVFATAVEFTFSPWLEVYTYRLHNVPAFVPPGHGLVYLAALTLARTDFFRRTRAPW